LQAVARDTDDHGAGALEVFVRVAEVLALGGAPGSVVAWVEVQHDRLAEEVGQREPAGGGVCLEVWNDTALGNGCHKVLRGQTGISSAMTRLPSAIRML